MVVDHSEPLFIEIRQLSEESERPDRIEVWTSAVNPQDCRNLLKALSAETPRDEVLSHLKRVKSARRQRMDESIPPMKKAKVGLEILLGRRRQDFDALVEKFNLQPQRTCVPGRPAESKQELEEFNQMWPTIYFHKSTKEHKELELALSKEEMLQMELGMKLVGDTGGAIIMNPTTGAVASHSRDEKLLQNGAAPLKNPLLCTPVLLAIQGISRLERKAALGHGMDSDTFRNGQYLCTGYDMYLEKEPDVFEAMALVHSRIRRVVFGHRNTMTGGIGGTGIGSAVPCLPGTNHRYRAFSCPSLAVSNKV